MDIVFVTGNRGKVESAKKYFTNTNVNLEWYDYDAIEPNINDIELIARTKVMNAYDMVLKPCIALDAGFYINSFPEQPGFPGAFPKREIFEEKEGITLGLVGLLDKMKDVEVRSCYFLECLAYFDGNEVRYFYGVSKGNLSTSVKGPNREGKWSELWSVFIPQNHTKTLAEMSDEERNNRNDNHTSALLEFANWCKSKDKQLIKKCL